MIYDFGPLAEWIHITAQYSKAVLVAIMPHVTDFAHRIGLQPTNEFATAAIRSVVINPRKAPIDVGMWFTNGCLFRFRDGYIYEYLNLRSYSALRDPERVPEFYAPVRITKQEAVTLARDTLQKLGLKLDAVFADMEPEVRLPEKVGTNVIPHYVVKWMKPHGGYSAKLEMDGNKQKVERINLDSPSLCDPKFKIVVTPETRVDHPLTGLRLRRTNPEYGYRLLPIVIEAVTNYAAKLQIPLPLPLTTNHIRRFYVGDNSGAPHSELELTNGMRFLYRNTTVVEHSAPDDFFSVASERRKTQLSDYTGHWRMSDREMIKLARAALAQLGYPKGFVHTEQKPQLILKPSGQFAKLIPRCQIHWVYPNSANQTQWSFVEIDADKKEIKSVHLDDESFRAQKPPIDVPISLPTQPQ